MNIEEIPAECFECEYYVRFLQNDSEWTCILCGMTEQVINLGGMVNHIWRRYELECKHQVHPLCYRRWCARTGKVGCSFCGPRSKSTSSRFCLECDSFYCSKHSNQ